PSVHPRHALHAGVLLPRLARPPALQRARRQEARRDGGPVPHRCRSGKSGLPLTSHTVRSPWGFLPSRAASPPTLPLLEVPLTSLPHLSGGSSQPPPVVRSALATQWRGHTPVQGLPARRRVEFPGTLEAVPARSGKTGGHPPWPLGQGLAVQQSSAGAFLTTRLTLALVDAT